MSPITPPPRAISVVLRSQACCSKASNIWLRAFQSLWASPSGSMIGSTRICCASKRLTNTLPYGNHNVSLVTSATRAWDKYRPIISGLFSRPEPIKIGYERSPSVTCNSVIRGGSVETRGAGACECLVIIVVGCFRSPQEQALTAGWRHPKSAIGQTLEDDFRKPGRRLPPGIDDQVGNFIVKRFTGIQKILQHLFRVAGLQQRALVIAHGPQAQVVKAGAQVNYHAMTAQSLPVGRGQNYASAGRQHDSLPGHQFAEHLRLTPAKSCLALELEDRRYRHPGLRDQFVVGIDKSKRQAFCQTLAQRAFACAGHAHQTNITLHSHDRRPEKQALEI